MIDKIYSILEKEYKHFKEPSVTQISKKNRTPFKALISCIISLRTKDEVTLKASQKLFSKADNPFEIIKLTEKEISDLIYPAGFYKKKAKTIKKISELLIKDFDGKVPNSLEKLLELPGVGRKTANLVLVEGFKIPAICVDTHVHRILNRIGYVDTKNPDETEAVLRKKLPKKYWISLNEILVAYGQNICKPISPLCTKCKIEKFCKKIGVTKFR